VSPQSLVSRGKKKRKARAKKKERKSSSPGTWGGSPNGESLKEKVMTPKNEE